MKESFPFVYKIIVPKEQIESFQEKMSSVIEVTKKHKSCILCVLLQDINDPHVFIIHEQWASMEEWREHMLSDAAQELTKFAEKYNIHLMIHTLQKRI